VNIVIYVLDSLRSDHLSCYGYHRETSPNIDLLASQSVIFERCYTPSTWTKPVAASILTGMYPPVHKVRGRSDFFTNAIPRLPTILKENDFQTACISAIGNVSTATGFAEGFDYFCDLFREPNLLGDRLRTTGAVEGVNEDEIVFPLAADINEYFFPWIKQHNSSKTFSLLWSIQTHAPYEPPAGFDKFVSEEYDDRFYGKRDVVRRVRDSQDIRYLIDLYDSEIYYNDHCIGELINYLKDTGEYDNTLLIILGDHGEAFGEHRLFAHGHLPYEPVMRVPMIIKFPQNEFGVRRVSEFTQLTDIFPTILSYLDVSFPEDYSTKISGKSIIPLLEESVENLHEHVYCETRYAQTKPTFLSVSSISWKYMRVLPAKIRVSNIKEIWRRIINERILFSILRNPTWILNRYGRLDNEYLFDLENDPDENENLSIRNAEKLVEMREYLKKWQAECELVANTFIGDPISVDRDEIMEKHLQALGYLD